MMTDWYKAALAGSFGAIGSAKAFGLPLPAIWSASKVSRSFGIAIWFWNIVFVGCILYWSL